MNEDENYGFEETDEDEALVEIIREYINSLPSNIVTVLNSKEFELAKKSVEVIVGIIKRYDPDAKCIIDNGKSPIDTTLGVRIITDIISIENKYVELFCAAMAMASGIDFAGRLDGKFEIDLIYYGIKENYSAQ